MKIYRKIWTEHFGDIPKDAAGRSYEIHHIDGNRNNNSIDNLICVDINEHYRIHHDRKEYGACNKILKRMKLSVKETAKLNSELMIKLWKDPEYRKKQEDRLQQQWSNESYVTKFKEAARKSNIDRVENKTHQFFSADVRRNNNTARAKVFAELTRTGNHNFQSEDAKRLSSEMAKKLNSIKSICPHCSKEGVGPVMKRHHFDNCKMLAVDSVNGQ